MRLAAAMLAASFVGACGSAAATTAAPPAGAAVTKASILVSDGGILRPIQNGGRVPLRGGWATVRFSSLNADHIDLDVSIFDTGGRSVAAAVRLEYESTDMDHGVMGSKAVGREGGYRIPIDIPMPGAFRMTLHVTRGAAEDTVTLVLPQVGY